MFISFLSFLQEFHVDYLIGSLHSEIYPFVNNICRSFNFCVTYIAVNKSENRDRIFYWKLKPN